MRLNKIGRTRAVTQPPLLPRELCSSNAKSKNVKLMKMESMGKVITAVVGNL
jgi:hypothetical protein